MVYLATVTVSTVAGQESASFEIGKRVTEVILYNLFTDAIYLPLNFLDTSVAAHCVMASGIM